MTFRLILQVKTRIISGLYLKDDVLPSLRSKIPIMPAPAMTHRLMFVLSAFLLAACGTVPTAPLSTKHITAEGAPPVGEKIPEPVQNAPVVQRPKPAAKVETYSVVVNNVRAQDLLFALARDAKLNVDVHPGITGTVTMNAIDQTLQQLLNRISRQVDMRWELDGPNLAVMPDTPFLRTYKVDYVNMSRDTTGSVTVVSQVASTAGISGQATGVGQSGTGTNSAMQIQATTKNHFWETLEKNVKDILRETDKILPEGSSETTIESASQQNERVTAAPSAANPTGTGNTGRSDRGQNIGGLSGQTQGTTVVKRSTFREAASVIVNQEAGVLTVRGTSRQQERIQEFLDQVMTSANRQVLIEATIAEVTLSDNYQQGIDWQALPLGRAGFTIKQAVSGTISNPSASLFELGYNNTASSVGNITSSIKLLESFGDVRVLSSPKLSVLNNQTAVLKVVDNLVYFTVKADTTANQSTTTTTFTTNLNSVPVGFVMSVTPQISGSDGVLLNIRPSISRKVGDVADPNPELKRVGVTSNIPVIRSREMDSVIRVQSGNIAVMGGLMEDSINNVDDTVPGLSKLPGLGNFFQNKNNLRSKTELVVFLRPLVIKNASTDGDYRSFRDSLPNSRFLEDKPTQRGSGQ